MAMSQKEIAEKYDVPQCDVSVAIKIDKVEHVGKRNVVTASGKAIEVNEYDDDRVASALVKLYLSKSDKHLEKAKEWSKKANSVYLTRLDI